MNLVLYLDDTQFPFLPASELSSDEYRAFGVLQTEHHKNRGLDEAEVG